MGWTQYSIQLFDNCKTNLVTSPLHLRYDSSQLTLIKMNWSVGGTRCILMHPDDNSAFLSIIKYLALTSEFMFNVSPDGPRL